MADLLDIELEQPPCRIGSHEARRFAASSALSAQGLRSALQARTGCAANQGGDFP
jgi:hypothetical protein